MFIFVLITDFFLYHIAWELLNSNYALKAESVEANASITRSYYLSISITVILAILSLTGTIAMLRLLCFHIRLGKNDRNY